MSGETYCIQHINDIRAIPAGRRGAFMRELERCLLMNDALGDFESGVALTGMLWTDDGDETTRMDLMNGGKVIGSLTLRPDAEGAPEVKA